MPNQKGGFHWVPVANPLDLHRQSTEEQGPEHCAANPEGNQEAHVGLPGPS